MKRALMVTALAALMLPAGIAAHEPPPTYHGRLRQLDVRVPKHAAEIRIDGIIDEAAWSEAALLTGFSQYAPVDGRAAEDSTEVLVMYSDHAIYFAVRAFEPHGTPIATLADRDRISGDDHIMFLLDTFNDRRRAFMFAVNGRGVQSDGMMSEGSGGGTDLSPDFLFDSKGRLTPDGYEIEVRIPFKSLRYQPSSVQSWGINVVRRVQHSGHEQTWTPAERGQPSFLAQSGTFVDMTELKRGLVVDLNPVMTQRTTGSQISATDPAWRYRREDPEFGGNVRWGVTSNLTLNGTFRPDFSQVEADVGQVVFDPRSALYFPEKRPFFLEGSENFETPNQLIYTRSITAPEGAAKLNGKIGDLNVGVLSAVDDDGLSATGEDNPLYNMVRLRRDFGAQSTAGLVYTDRMEGDDYNRVAGIDSRAVVAGLIMFGQVAGSWTREGDADLSGALFEFAVSKTGRTFGWNAGVDGVHPDFITRSGFLSRTGVAHANAGPRWTFFRTPGSLIETFSVNTYLDGTWDYRRFEKGTFPNDLKWHFNLNGSLRGGWRATVMSFLETFKYPGELYTNFYLEQRNASGVVTDTVPYTGVDRLTNIGGMISVNTPQWQKFSANGNITFGHDDNFDEWSPAWIALTSFSADWRPTQQIRVNGRYLEQRYHRVSDGSLVRLSTIPRLKIEYQVARPFFVRFVGQYNATKVDALRDDSRTEAPILIRNPVTGVFRQSVARESSGFRSDVLLSYQPNPGTVIFAGYGNTLSAPRDFFEPGNLDRASDGFFVKISYLFRL